MSSAPSDFRRKEYIPEIELLRTMAVLAVIMIHSSGFVLAELAKDSGYYLPYSFLSNASAFAVPVFLLLSGFVLFYSYLDRPLNFRTLGSFYRKRLLTVVVPYVSFSIVYYLARHLQDSDLFSLATLRRFAYLLLTGQTYTHLYYMIVIVQFYLLFPLLLYAVQRSRSPLIVLLAGVLLQWTYYFVNRELIAKLTSIPEVFHHTADFFASYLAYFLFGAYLAAHSEKFMSFAKGLLPAEAARRRFSWLLLAAVWLASGFYYAYLNYMGSAHKIWAASQTFQFVWFVYNMASGVVLFGLAAWLYRRLGAGWRRAVVLLGQCSFGIYLLHPLVLLYYRKLPVSGNPLLFHLFFVGEFASALLVSWAVVYVLMRRLRWSWVLFGTGLARRTGG